MKLIMLDLSHKMSVGPISEWGRLDSVLWSRWTVLELKMSDSFHIEQAYSFVIPQEKNTLCYYGPHERK